MYIKLHRKDFIDFEMTLFSLSIRKSMEIYVCFFDSDETYEYKTFEIKEGEYVFITV